MLAEWLDRPVAEDELDAFREKLGLSFRKKITRQESMMQLLELQQAVVKFYLNCSHVLMLLECFPTDPFIQSDLVVWCVSTYNTVPSTLHGQPWC